MPKKYLRKPITSFNKFGISFFQEKVYRAVRKIPRGKVLTYRQVAKLAGSPKAARAVGNALNKNPDLRNIPCHRVVRSNGKVGGYRLGQKKKIQLLEKEGVLIKNDKMLF